MMLKRGKSETVRADLRRLSSEAKTLHVEALAIADETRSIALSAVEKGWQCGKRLNAMKKILGHGHWLPYLKTHLPEISQSTAQRYMKIDRDNPNAARVQDLKSDSIRKHCLSLAPAKKQIDHPGNVKFPRLVDFANIINEFARIKQRHLDGLEEIDFVQVREDAKELYSLLRWLYSDATGSPWAK
jgi:Protein of unknown function (DUF3102)